MRNVQVVCNVHARQQKCTRYEKNSQRITPLDKSYFTKGNVLDSKMLSSVYGDDLSCCVNLNGILLMLQSGEFTWRREN